MTLEEKKRLRAEVIRIVMSDRDPAVWLVTIRAIAERLGLKVESFLHLPTTLQHATFEIIEAVHHDDMSADSVAKALSAMVAEQRDL
jgi:hypothetical protein